VLDKYEQLKNQMFDIFFLQKNIKQDFDDKLEEKKFKKLLE